MNEKSTLKKKRKPVPRRKTAGIPGDTSICKQLVSFTNASNDVISTTIDPIVAYSLSQKSKNTIANNNYDNTSDNQTSDNIYNKATSSKNSFKGSSKSFKKKPKRINNYHDVENELENLTK